MFNKKLPTWLGVNIESRQERINLIQNLLGKGYTYGGKSPANAREINEAFEGSHCMYVYVHTKEKRIYRSDTPDKDTCSKSDFFEMLGLDEPYPSFKIGFGKEKL